MNNTIKEQIKLIQNIMYEKNYKIFDTNDNYIKFIANQKLLEQEINKLYKMI
jgi:heme oxygenase